MSAIHILCDTKQNNAFFKGPLLRKGRFSECYMVGDSDVTYACKSTYSNSKITKSKISQQMAIHEKLSHENIVQLVSHFIENDGDFGSAIENKIIGYMYDTADYTAPEILQNRPHSFEVDVWSLACIMYKLLVGRAPFESQSLQETFSKIIQVDFACPNHMDGITKTLICSMLCYDQAMRPTMSNLLGDQYFRRYIPNGLPRSALVTVPRFNNFTMTEGNGAELCTLRSTEDNSRNRIIENLDILKSQIQNLFHNADVIALMSLNESEDPNISPQYWVAKWNSTTYGWEYMFNDLSTGIIFEDNTEIILTAGGVNIQYINQHGVESLYTITNYPKWLNGKVQIMRYNRRKMVKNLESVGSNNPFDERVIMERVPSIRFITRIASNIVMYLNTGILQITFVDDDSTFIMCPLMRAITYTQPNGTFKTLSLEKMIKNGISWDWKNKLGVVLDAIRAVFIELNN